MEVKCCLPIFLKREGIVLNHKRLRRIYREGSYKYGLVRNAEFG